MRLKVSGDKPEIRQHYIPALFPKIVKPLIDVGAVSILILASTPPSALWSLNLVISECG